MIESFGIILVENRFPTLQLECPLIRTQTLIYPPQFTQGVSTPIISYRQPRFEIDRPVIRLQRFFELSQLPEHVGLAIIVGSIVWLQAQQALVHPQSLCITFEIVQHI